MDLRIENVEESQFADYVRAMFWAAGRNVDDDFIAERRRFTDRSGCVAAFDGDRLVGTVGTRSLTMTVPGGTEVPVAAIGQGGVLPSHTRRGIMRRLMERSFAMAQEHDVPIATWTTSEWPLYERYGGGPATHAASYEIDRRLARLRPDLCDERRCELVPLDGLAEVLARLHAQGRTHGGSLVARDAAYWSVVLDRWARGETMDFLDIRGGRAVPFACVHRDADGQIDGLAVYRIEHEWNRGLYHTGLELLTMQSASQAATTGLWRFLLSLDLVERLHLPHRPVDEGLRWLLVDGRRLETVSTGDHVWLRIMDVAQALRRRAFPRLPRPLVVGVRDAMLEHNDATFCIDTREGTSLVERTQTTPDVQLDVAVLSALYLGGNSLRPFVESGRVTAKRDDDLQDLACLFSRPSLPFVDNDF